MLRRAAADEQGLPAPRQAASLITAAALVAAALGIVAGLQQAAASVDTVRGSVFEDADADGVRGAEEVGVAGVVVVAVDESGNRSLPVSSGLDGSYVIDLTVAEGEELASGPYRIEFSGWPAGLGVGPFGPDNGSAVQFAAAGDSGVSLGLVATGQQDSELEGNDVETEDALSAPGPSTSGPETDQGGSGPAPVAPTSTVPEYSAAVGNRVWLDNDRDGFQDEDERGVGDVTVQLLDGNGAVLATAVTDASGTYRFTGLAPGSYRVRVVFPASMVPTAPNVVAGDLTDSDIDAGGTTPEIVVATDEEDLSWDAGLFVPTAVMSSPVATNDAPQLAFTGRAVTGLLAAGLLLIGLGGSAQIMADRLRRRSEVA